MKLLVVMASVRKGRAGEKVANWFMDVVKKDGRFEPELVDLKDLNLPYELPEKLASEIHDGSYEYEETRAWADRVNAADAVVFVSPEYNHSITASVKNAIDHLYKEWNHKPVGVVNYGASSVAFSFVAFWIAATWVKMDVVGPRVSIPQIWAAFNENNELLYDDYHRYEADGMLGALEVKVKAQNNS